jgi:hypothetical protein
MSANVGRVEETLLNFRSAMNVQLKFEESVAAYNQERTEL